MRQGVNRNQVELLGQEKSELFLRQTRGSMEKLGYPEDAGDGQDCFGPD